MGVGQDVNTTMFATYVTTEFSSVGQRCEAGYADVFRQAANPMAPIALGGNAPQPSQLLSVSPENKYTPITGILMGNADVGVSAVIVPIKPTQSEHETPHGHALAVPELVPALYPWTRHGQGSSSEWIERNRCRCRINRSFAHDRHSSSGRPHRGNAHNGARRPTQWLGDSGHAATQRRVCTLGQGVGSNIEIIRGTRIYYSNMTKIQRVRL